MDDSLGSKRVSFFRTQTSPSTPPTDDLSTGQMDISSAGSVRPPVPLLSLPPLTRSTVMREPLAAVGPSRVSSVMRSGNEQDSTGTRLDTGMRHYGLYDSSNSAPTRVSLVVASRPAFSSSLKPRTLQGEPVGQSNKSKVLIEYGTGTWSVVYQAVYPVKGPSGMTKLEIGLPSRPEFSESVNHCRSGGTHFVAVKAPRRYLLEDAKSVLRREAQILTYIQPFAFEDPAKAFQEHVVTFLGFVPELTAIVMEALPLTLSAFSQTRGKIARETFSTRTMHEPVVGTEQWLVFANKLLAGLEFLKGLKIVHGDIKPTNILIRVRSSSKSDVLAKGNPVFDPVYCDFSSAHVVQEGIEPEPISAITAPYTAPELLEALRHHPGGENEPVRPACTYSSDVFALGATLLVPAIGSELYDEISNSMQKLAMARQGDPLEGARRSQQPWRVMSGSLVDRVVRGAVAKKPDDRLDLHTWKVIVEGEMKMLEGDVAQ